MQWQEYSMNIENYLKKKWIMKLDVILILCPDAYHISKTG